MSQSLDASERDDDRRGDEQRVPADAAAEHGVARRPHSLPSQARHAVHSDEKGENDRSRRWPFEQWIETARQEDQIEIQDVD